MEDENSIMKADYKNWMPQGMINGFAASAVVCWTLFWIINNFNLLTIQPTRSIVSVALLVLWVLFLLMTVWMFLMHRAFSYDGKRQMSKQIIQGVSSYVNVPDGGKCLDVGCGSGALTIACAKKNPNAEFVGIDRWGKEYASFSKNLCENNAKAEGVSNVSFGQGDATKLSFADETFDAVTSNYVYHNIPSKDRQAILLETLRTLKKGGTFAIHDIMSKGKYGDMEAFVKQLKDMGYEEVKLIDTTNGMFMTKFESTWMGLSGSAILVGRK
jgi:ubiquinone/menaquinone biosynthesis C-methylase UbiE